MLEKGWVSLPAAHLINSGSCCDGCYVVDAAEVIEKRHCRCVLPCFARIQHELFERCSQRVGHRINDQLVKVLPIGQGGLLAELPQPALVGGSGLL